MNDYSFDQGGVDDNVTRRVDPMGVTRATGGQSGQSGQAWQQLGASESQPTVVIRRGGSQRGMAWLIGSSGSDRGRHFRIDPDGTVIGRDPATCTVIVDDPAVSRQHAKVRGEMVDGHIRYYILDMGSRSGTRVNDTRIDRIRLEDGARVAIGQTELVFKQSAR